MRIVELKDVEARLKDRDFVKVPELAKLLGTTPEYIYILLREGKLAGYKVASEWRIPTTEIIRVLKAWNNPKPSKPSKTKPRKVKKDLTSVISFVIGFITGGMLTYLFLYLIK